MQGMLRYDPGDVLGCQPWGCTVVHALPVAENYMDVLLL